MSGFQELDQFVYLGFYYLLTRSLECIYEIVNSCFNLLMMFIVKGGGWYGSEVTRGQDLTGKDFSGKTLIKQDFKMALN